MRLFEKPDFLLIHPPSVYDFRETPTMPSPIADLVPSGPLFEMYPIGFSFLGEYLERNGIRTRIFNLATRMLEKPGVNVERLISRMEPAAFGIGLHWLPSCHGALEVARIIKRTHPDRPVIMGGYSASIFHRELVKYPQVDFVIRGDSAEEPLLGLLRAINENRVPSDVPNLTYSDSATGEVVENEQTYVPADLEHLGDNYTFMLRSAMRYRDLWGLRAFKGWWSYPLTAVLTCRGCLNNCSFCGGSRFSMKRCFGRKEPAFRSPESIAGDIETVSRFTGAPIFVIGDLRQNGDEYARSTLDAIARVAPGNHVILELFEPAPRDFFSMVASCIPNFDFEISPESHDEQIRYATGKRYENSELEQNLEWALDSGCDKLDLFFMIGLSGQTRESVMDTVSYCSDILERYGPRVNPLIGPLAPFLDPGSISHSRAGDNGYRLFFENLEDYRRALVEPNWRDMLSYETRWMTRQELVDTTYAALLELNRVKLEHGQISKRFAGKMERFLLRSVSILESLDEAGTITDAGRRDAELRRIMKAAWPLWRSSDLVKEEIKWPTEGRKFKYMNILRMVKAQT